MGLEGNPSLAQARCSGVGAQRPRLPGCLRAGEVFPTCATWENGTGLQNLSGDLNYAVQTSLSLCLCNRMHVWIWMSVHTAAQRLENRFTFHTESELLPHKVHPARGAQRKTRPQTKTHDQRHPCMPSTCFVTSI